jgi:hypothetical protein
MFKIRPEIYTTPEEDILQTFLKYFLKKNIKLFGLTLFNGAPTFAQTDKVRITRLSFAVSSSLPQKMSSSAYLIKLFCRNVFPHWGLHYKTFYVISHNFFHFHSLPP